jgi:hypothetical protein
VTLDSNTIAATTCSASDAGVADSGTTGESDANTGGSDAGVELDAGSGAADSGTGHADAGWTKKDGGQPADAMLTLATWPVSKTNRSALWQARLTDLNGHGIAGATVTFELISSTGSIVQTASTVTTSYGVARMTVLLSSPPGNYVLRVRFGGEGAPRNLPPAEVQVTYTVTP